MISIKKTSEYYKRILGFCSQASACLALSSDCLYSSLNGLREEHRNAILYSSKEIRIIYLVKLEISIITET